MSVLVEGGKRAAYVAVLGTKPDEYIVALCVEGDDGYRPLDDLYPPGPEGDIKALAGRLNARIGVTDAEARLIAFSTMPRHTPG